MIKRRNKKVLLKSNKNMGRDKFVVYKRKETEIKEPIFNLKDLKETSIKFSNSEINYEDFKNMFYKVFKSFDEFKEKFSKFDKEDSLVVASYFAQLYSYGYSNEKRISDHILYFVKYTQTLEALQVMYYTSYNSEVDSLIVNRILELDKDKYVCKCIFADEGKEYCPKEIISYLCS